MIGADGIYTLYNFDDIPHLKIKKVKQLKLNLNEGKYIMNNDPVGSGKTEEALTTIKDYYKSCFFVCISNRQLFGVNFAAKFNNKFLEFIEIDKSEIKPLINYLDYQGIIIPPSLINGAYNGCVVSIESLRRFEDFIFDYKRKTGKELIIIADEWETIINNITSGETNINFLDNLK